MSAAVAPASNRERISAWADFVYTRRGGVTHVLPWLDRPVYPSTLCGRELSGGDTWFGTGSQAEHDRARSMPLCIRCMKASDGRTR